MSRNLPAVQTAAVPARLTFNDEELDLIKSTLLAGQNVTDAEFSVFRRAAEHLGLDPLMKQVYGIKRKGRLTIQVGIDGYRLVAARTGEFVGSGRPIYGPAINDAGWPEWAEVTVTRLVGGERAEFVGLAYWDEFYPGPDTVGAMWRQMPRKMLAKCAEAEALRKAFPADLAGTYTPDEMAQSGQEDPLRHYRDDLIARALALPEAARAGLRDWRHAAGIDPRTADLDDLRRFEGELSRLEDDTVVDAELVDDGCLPATAGESGDVTPPPEVTSPHPAMEHTLNAARYDKGPVGFGDVPVTPQDIARKAQYAIDQRAKKASREAVDQQLAEADA